MPYEITPDVEKVLRIYDYEEDMHLSVLDSLRLKVATFILGERLWKFIYFFLTRGYFEEKGWMWDVEEGRWMGGGREK